jgi:hypothetical protein
MTQHFCYSSAAGYCCQTVRCICESWSLGCISRRVVRAHIRGTVQLYAWSGEDAYCCIAYHQPILVQLLCTAAAVPVGTMLLNGPAQRCRIGVRAGALLVCAAGFSLAGVASSCCGAGLDKMMLWLGWCD